MRLSRRHFLSASGLPSPAFPSQLITARGREAVIGETGAVHGPGPEAVPPLDTGEIRLSSNENPLGPGPVGIAALLAEIDQVSLYPFNSRQSGLGLQKMLAKEFHTEPANIVLGAGSSEILRNAVRAFTSPNRPLVTADPSFERPVQVAKAIGSPIEAVPVDGELGLDLDTMERAAQGAGLVFLCNPNNPTGTVHSFEAVERFVSRLHQFSPRTTILIDEAYHEYVTKPSYATAVPLALTRPRVCVSRTFSKAFGMAGLRVGYAVGGKPTISKLAGYKLKVNVNVLGLATATAVFNDSAHLVREKVRNQQVRKFTTEFFQAAGLKTTDSQANFVFVKIGRPAKQFLEACKKQRVSVGREFPPLEKTHARISLGTMDEMQGAVRVFEQVLDLTKATESE